MEAANSNNPPASLAFVNLQVHTTNIDSDDNEDLNWNNSNTTSHTGSSGCRVAGGYPENQGSTPRCVRNFSHGLFH